MPGDEGDVLSALITRSIAEFFQYAVLIGIGHLEMQAFDRLGAQFDFQALRFLITDIREESGSADGNILSIEFVKR